MKFRRIVGVSQLALVGVLVAGCSALGLGGKAAPARPAGAFRPAISVQTAKVTSGPISENALYTGTVQGSDSVNVEPQISGRIVKLNVDVGSTVKAGQVIAELDKSTLEDQVAQAQAGVEAAQVKLQQVQAGARSESVAAANANVAAAQAKLAALQAGPRSQTVAEAKANLDAAKAKLAQLELPPTQDQIKQAQLQIEQAKNSLFAANTTKDGACNPRNPAYQCQAAQASADAAQTAVTIAQQNLTNLNSPPTKEAIQQDQAAIDAAQQAYLLAQNPNTPQDIAQAQAAVNAAAAQAQLAAKPYTSLDVKAAQVGVAQAQATLATAKSALEEANVLAPFDGIVTAKLLTVGSLASPSTPIVSIMSPKLQVQFALQESLINAIKTGQTVNLTSTAFPGKLFPSDVTQIYPSANPTTHTFTVVVVPTNANGQLKAGMFVNLDVTIAQNPHAVLVPNAAIVQQGQQQVVYTVSAGKAHLQPITTGIADNQNAEVMSGLKPGDEVVVIGQGNLTDGSSVRVVGAGSPGKSGAAPANGKRPTGAKPAAG